MVWQRAGTVAVQNGSTTVTGAGVDFAASSRVGDSFIGPDGATYEVANVASSTVISILPAYKGPTVTGAAYAIMPVQGYDKMLSDAFNSLNNQFGPKLAALGTTGNYDVLPVTKGGTGNNTGTASKLAGAGILGTVSQSGGTPTGSIIEKGSTATGEYTKFADGTMICRRSYTFSTSTENPFNGAFVSGYIPWIFPAAFVASPSVIVTPKGDTALFGMVGALGSGTMENIRIGWPISTGEASRSANFVAIGRWF